MESGVIYTVGHSRHPLDYFLILLQGFGVDCLVDVRSIAASAHNPQYNQKPLSNFLNQNGILYLHFPKEFGAWQTNPQVLNVDGKVDFEKVRRSANFRQGVERLKLGMQKGFTIALMCSESNPFDCHRFSMIAAGLQKEGVLVWHIMKDKTLLSTQELEHLLLKKYAPKLPKPDMFQTKIGLEEQLNAAYRLRNQDIAHSPNPAASPPG
jgi:uncharacterized protein (DUF488 family)